jgi:RNA polymerase sigma factor (sigma-70 family)
MGLLLRSEALLKGVDTPFLNAYLELSNRSSMGPSEDTLTFWLNNAGRYPVLKNEEVIMLSRVIHEHGEDSKKGRRAINKLVNHNLRLVPLVTKKVVRTRKAFWFGDQHTIDLLQAGTIGLQRAAVKFDYSRGYRFSTYAYMWIKQTVQRQMYSLSSLIHVPEQYFRSQAKMQDALFMKELYEENPKVYDRTVHAVQALAPFVGLTFKSDDHDGNECSRADSVLITENNEPVDTVDQIFGLLQQSINPVHKEIVIEACCHDASLKSLAEKHGTIDDVIKRIIKNTLRDLRPLCTR